MAVSARPEDFFQTTSSIAENERKQRKAANTQGAPLKFPTKLLAVTVDKGWDPSGDVVFVAEAGGSISGIRLSTNEVSRTGKASSAPLTCMAYHTTRQNVHDPFVKHDIYAGGWDKTITKYQFQFAIESYAGRMVTDQTSFPAHTDFVKCVLFTVSADNQTILITGGADGDVNVWNATNHARLATLKPQCRAIECIAIDLYSEPSAPTVFFSTSQREIFSFTMPELALISSATLQESLSAPIVAHETSVYKLHFDHSGDLWTASADKTAKHLIRDHAWAPDTTLQHPDFVRDVVTAENLPYVVTACRDEDIRVWDAATSQLYHVFTGHYEEVTGLVITGDTTNDHNNTNSLLVSVSIDATLRRWSLHPDDLRREVDRAKNPHLIEDVPEPDVRDLGLTEEEEAELRAMMDEQEADTLEQMAMDTQ